MHIILKTLLAVSFLNAPLTAMQNSLELHDAFNSSGEKKLYKSYEQLLNTEKEKTNYNTFVSQEPTESNHVVLKTIVKKISNSHPGVTFEGEKNLDNEQCFDPIKRIVSYITFTVTQEPEKQSICEINLIETLKEHRNNGYASLLLQNVEDEMKRSQCSKMILCAVHGKTSFYEKKGFSRINCTSNSMEKQLNA